MFDCLRFCTQLQFNSTKLQFTLAERAIGIEVARDLLAISCNLPLLHFGKLFLLRHDDDQRDDALR